MAQPSISIIVPTYNRAHLLPRLLRSLLAQSWPDFELIVADDGSTDETPNVVAAFADPRIRYIRCDHGGAAAARNAGAAHAVAEIVTFIDSDDEAKPAWLETLLGPFQSPVTGVVCAGIERVASREGREIQRSVLLPQRGGVLYAGQTVLFQAGSFAVRKSIFSAVGGYTVERRSGQQNELGWRIVPYCLAHGWKIVAIPTPLAIWHCHDGARLSQNPEMVLSGTQHTLQHYGALLLAQEPRVYTLFCSIAGVNAFRLMRYPEARYYFRHAVVHSPHQWRHYARLLLSYLPPLAHHVWSRYEPDG